MPHANPGSPWRHVFVVLVALLSVTPHRAEARQAVGSPLLVKLTREADRRAVVVASKEGVTTGLESIDALNRSYRAVTMERVFPFAGKFEARHEAFGLHQWYRVVVSSGEPIDRIVSAYEADPNVEGAERLEVRRRLHDTPARSDPGTTGSAANRFEAIPATLPNDPRFPTQWHFHNTGQSGGTADADIDLPEAWDLSTGSSAVIVAVLDSGVDVDHPDLASNLWVNPGEIPGNGIDDDNNGFKDDVNGWDFSDRDLDPNDTDGHGSHVAGTIAGASQNGTGIAGIAGGFGGGGARIMALKIFENATDQVIANAFVYAADNGAVISSNSWGGGGQSDLIEDAIDYFIAKAGGPGAPMTGGLVVFAAGNENSSSTSNAYPASYSPVMAVAATDRNDKRASFSNFGSWVDIAAPGVAIVSTVVGGYASYDGTSMAAPHVSGVAALVASYSPGLTAQQVRARLESTTDDLSAKNPNFVGKLGTGRLNAFAALAGRVAPPPIDTTVPARITDLAVSSVASTSLVLRWTATGDDRRVGTAQRYGIWYDTKPIAALGDAVQAVTVPIPQAAGATETFTLGGLRENTSYWIRIRAYDEAGNASATSNQASATTKAGPSLALDAASVTMTVRQGETGTAVVRMTNTGSVPVDFVAAVAPDGPASTVLRRVIDAAYRSDKEMRRASSQSSPASDAEIEDDEIPSRPPGKWAPPTLQSSATILVWDPDQHSATGERFKSLLTALGHTVKRVTSLASIPDLSSYDQVYATLGMYPFNHEMTEAEGNRLAGYLDAGGRLYLEGGDTWVYDVQRRVHAYFDIVGVDDGIRDLRSARGLAGTWTAGADWPYATGSQYGVDIDRIAAAGSGRVILRNEEAGYAVTIATDHGAYRAVGSSLSIGGLKNSADRSAFVAGVFEFLATGSGNPTGPWVAVLPANGTLAVGSFVDLELSFDAAVLTEGVHAARLTVGTADGSVRLTAPVSLVVSAPAPRSLADASPDAPLTFSLEQNYPNPFNPVTSIRYSLAEPGPVSLDVFDMSGRQVASLVNGMQEAGVHEVAWDSRAGLRPVSSGMYVYRIRSGRFVGSRTMVLLK